MNELEAAERMTEALAIAGVCGDVLYFIPSLFEHPVRPGLPGCNWKIIRMN